MANSIVSICNAALSLVGSARITNATLGSATEEERQCSLLYPILRDSLLRKHPWNFAESRAQLASLTETPPFQYDYYYQLPADSIRVLRCYASEAATELVTDFRVEASGKIATNESLLYVVYTAQVVNPTLFDPLFVEALTYRLAAHLAFALANNQALQAQLNRMAEETLRTAKMIDGQEGMPLNIKMSNAWTNFRSRWR